MKKFLLMISCGNILFAMDTDHLPESLPRIQLRRELLPVVSRPDYLQRIIQNEEYEFFCDAFAILPVEKYHEVLSSLKNHLAEDRKLHKKFVHDCYLFMISFIRNQEKTDEGDEDFFNSIELLNSDSFEELRILLTQDHYYDSEASIEEGSEEEHDW